MLSMTYSSVDAVAADFPGMTGGEHLVATRKWASVSDGSTQKWLGVLTMDPTDLAQLPDQYRSGDGPAILALIDGEPDAPHSVRVIEVIEPLSVEEARYALPALRAQRWCIDGTIDITDLREWVQTDGLWAALDAIDEAERCLWAATR